MSSTSYLRINSANSATEQFSTCEYIDYNKTHIHQAVIMMNPMSYNNYSKIITQYEE